MENSSDYVYRKVTRFGSALALSVVMAGAGVVSAQAQQGYGQDHDDPYNTQERQYGDRDADDRYGGRYDPDADEQGYYDSNGRYQRRSDPNAQYQGRRRGRRGNNSGYNDGGYYENGGYTGPIDDRRGNKSPRDVVRVAQQNGYRDGAQRGQYDRQQGVRRPNPRGHGAYQYALNGWDPEWGSGRTFQQYYRQTFLQGYQEGYGQRTQYRRRY